MPNDDSIDELRAAVLEMKELLKDIVEGNKVISILLATHAQEIKKLQSDIVAIRRQSFRPIE